MTTEQSAISILKNFSDITGIKTEWLTPKIRTANYPTDGVAYIQVHPKKKIKLPAEVKKVISYPHLITLNEQRYFNGGLLILAENIMPAFRKKLQKLHINYIDSAGNAYIKAEGNLLWLDGHKDVPVKTKETLFSKTGIKVIFLLLNDNNYINKTIRDIAAAAGTSLDTAHKTVRGLKSAGYLIALDDQTLGWIRKKELFEQWITEYNAKLKPGLHIGNLRFVNEKDFNKWPALRLNNQKSHWGGEAAGEILTNYLKAETLTIYTDEPKIDLIKNYRMVPDPHGYITVYLKFWRDHNENTDTVPPTLVYADLVNSGLNRNIETAQKIYERDLQDKFA